MAKKIFIIVNSLRKVNADIQFIFDYLLLHTHQYETSIKYTKHSNHAYELAIDAGNQNMDIVISVGGDGTFHEVVNGILDGNNNHSILALIPNGTGNDFHGGTSKIFSGFSFLSSLELGAFSRYDVGQIESTTNKKYFINIADIGFGGYTAQLLDQQRKKGLAGSFSYSVAIIRSFLSFKKPDVNIYKNEQKIYDGPMMMLAFCNGDRFADGLIIHPGAQPDDALLNITIIGDLGMIDYLKNLQKLKKGIRINHQKVHYLSGTNFSVQVKKGQAPIECDGELMASHEYNYVQILPSMIKILNA